MKTTTKAAQWTAWAALCAATALAGQAWAQGGAPGTGPYAGGAIGFGWDQRANDEKAWSDGIIRERLDDILGEGWTSSGDETTLGLSVYTGYAFTPMLSAEVAFTWMDEFESTTRGERESISTSSSLSSIGAFAVFTAPLDTRFVPFARGGFHRWDTRTKVRAGDETERQDNDGIDGAFGAGLIGNVFDDRAIRMRMEWTWLDLGDSDGVHFFGIGAQYGF